MTSAVALEEAGDRDTWDALPQSIPEQRSRAQSSELLGLGEDYEMGFEAASTPSPQREHEASLANQALVADYRSISIMSTKSVSYDNKSRDIVSYLLLPFPPFCSTPC